MIKNYLKVALKVLARRKFFTFISLFGISVTLVVVLVVTALLDHVFAPHAPETRAGRTLGIYQMKMTGPAGMVGGYAGYAFLDRHIRDLPRTVPGVERVSFASLQTVSSYRGGRKISSKLKRTDGEFWQIFDFEFLEGAPFTAADEANANFVAVINETTRRRFFGAALAAGRTLEADGQRFRVVGVVRDVPFLRIAPFADIWVPISTARSSSYKDEWIGSFIGLILARDRADFPAIKAEVDARFRRAQLPDPKSYDTLRGGADTLFETFSRTLFTRGWLDESYPGGLLACLIGTMVLFLLLPAINLVNINLSRILDRASEIGVRKAFGASSWTLVGQFVVENLVLTLAGAALGLALAAAVLAGVNESGLIPYARLALNLRVFFQAIAIAVFFGLLSGVYPAWRMSRLNPVDALRGRSA